MSKPNSFPRLKGHRPECMCAGCEFPPANSPRRLSPAPAPESQGESVAAPAEVGQVRGTTCCTSPRSDCMGMLVPGIGNRCKAMHQKGGALLLLLVAIALFFMFLRALDNRYPCGFDPVDRMNCKLEQGT